MKQILMFSAVLLTASLYGCGTQSTSTRLSMCQEALDLYKTNENVKTPAVGQQIYDRAGQCLAQKGISDQTQRTMYLIQGYAAEEKLHDYPRAISAMEHVASFKSSHQALDTLILSRLYRLNGQAEKALQLVQSNIDSGLGESGKGSGFHMPTYYHLSQALYDLGRYRESAEAISAGLRSQPDYAWGYWQRGLAYDALKQTDDARLDFKQFAKRVNQDYLEPEQRAKLAQYTIQL